MGKFLISHLVYNMEKGSDSLRAQPGPPTPTTRIPAQRGQRNSCRVKAWTFHQFIRRAQEAAQVRTASSHWVKKHPASPRGYHPRIFILATWMSYPRIFILATWAHTCAPPHHRQSTCSRLNPPQDAHSRKRRFTRTPGPNLKEISN